MFRFFRLVQDEVYLVPHLEWDLYIKSKKPKAAGGHAISVFSLRESAMEASAKPAFDSNAVSDQHQQYYNATWCKLDQVEFSNKSLNLKPFKWEPP